MAHDDAGEAPALPDGWVWTTLGEACEVNPGVDRPQHLTDETPVSFVPMAAVDDAQGAIVRFEARPIGKVWKGYTRFADNDIIFAKITPCMENGKCAIARGLLNGIALGSTEFHVLRPSDAVVSDWIYYFLRQESFRVSAQAEMTGTAGQLRVPASFMREAAIPLAPLPEQRRIVAEIETQFTRLEAGVAALKRARVKLRRYKAAVLQAACEGRLVPTEADLARAEGRDYEPADALLRRILTERRAKWEAEHPGKRYQEPAPPDPSDLPELPEGWVWATLEHIADHRLGKMLDKAKNKGIPRPYLRNLNVRWFEFDLSDVQLIRVTDEELSNVSVQSGDLVVCEGGEPGRAAVWEGATGSMVIQKALHRVRPAPGVSAHYLALRLAVDASSGHLQSYFTGSTIKHFTGQSLRSYTYPMPPTTEQHRIVAEVERRLSVAGELEKQVEAALRRAERLRQAILKRAFEGRLVPQDPNDEPAAVLLARIRAGRSGYGAGAEKQKEPRQMRLPMG